MQKTEIAFLPFEQAANLWLETRRPFLAPRTLRDYAEYIAALSPFFLESRLGEIGPEHLRAFQKMRLVRIGAARINQECGILQQMLKRIGRWQDIADDYQPLPVKKELRGRALSDKEYERLFRYARSNPAWEMAYLYAVISVNTTMRPNEVMTLRRQDIDIPARTIRVKRENAKNQGSARTNPLNDLALAACERALELAAKRSSTRPEHFVFPFKLSGNCYGGTYDPSRPVTTFKTAWKKLITAANLPGLRPYDMRHTGITNLLQLPEVSLETCKAIAGHISAEIVKTYSHIGMSARREALDALMRATTKKPPRREYSRAKTHPGRAGTGTL